MASASVVGGSFCRLLSTIVWCCLLGALAVSGWEHVSESGLVQALAEHEFVLVAFISQNDPRSAALEPEWLSATAAEDQEQHLISIDCVSSEAACRRFGAGTAAASIQLFRRGHPVAVYQGARRAEALLSFLARRKRPIVVDIHTPDELSALKTADETVFVAFLGPDADDSASAGAFSELAARYRDEFTFGRVADGSVVEAGGVGKTPTVVCYRTVDGETLTFSALHEPRKLDAWVQDVSRLVLGDLTGWNRQRLLDRGWPMVYLFASTATQRSELQTALRRFAQSYYDSLTCVLVDPVEFPELVEQMGLARDISFPAGAVHQLSKDRIYPYPRGRAFTSRSVQQWGLDVYQGRVKPWTPPGVTTVYEDLAPTMVATRRVSIRSFPGLKVKVAGHGEL
ncbi:thioredoxin-like domain-containing protein [Podospora appendiculata]|uniref:protein disulfide-isomerase n=1 Tax=Podospora appendiculata TaxID=314037 RepID=A0AAE1CFA7_9PEZI|nr:thioredoxin-like domain-containing protein [Podospora appendiculata]